MRIETSREDYFFKKREKLVYEHHTYRSQLSPIASGNCTSQNKLL